MRRLKVFVVYFPVLLVSGQVICNLLFFIAPKFYFNAGFYLNLTFGTNILFAVYLFAMAMALKFCAISRWAAIAELLFALNYLLVKQDNLYNILFQVIVGLIAIILTFGTYMKKFPLCSFSLVLEFFRSLFATKCDLHKAEENWKAYVIKHHHHATNNRP